MKILFFLEDYYLGGVDTFVINLINNWPYDTDELSLICNRQHTGLSFIRESLTKKCHIVEHNIIIFNSFFELKEKNNVFDKFITILLKLSAPVLRYIFLAYNVLALRRILLNQKSDRLMIINGGYPGGDSCRAASICWGLFSKKPKSIHNFHGIVTKPGIHIWLQENIVDFLTSFYTEKFVTVSNATAKTIKNRIAIKNNKILFIYNGITFLNNALLNNKVNIKEEFNIPQNSHMCLMLGGYHFHKNFDKGHNFLFQVFKNILTDMPNTYLLICGYGSNSNMNRISKLTNDYNIKDKIRLCGFRKDILTILKNTDLVLIASQAFESFCLATIEAMANSIPVVATNVGAIPEIVISGEGGYCFEKNDAIGYSNAVMKLLKDNDLRRKQGEKGYSRYKNNFTGQRMAEEYANLIHMQ